MHNLVVRGVQSHLKIICKADLNKREDTHVETITSHFYGLDDSIINLQVKKMIATYKFQQLKANILR